MVKREDFSQELYTGGAGGTALSGSQAPSGGTKDASNTSVFQLAQANNGDQSQIFDLANAPVKATFTSTVTGTRIVLPPGTAIDQVFISGLNLYLVQADGTVIVILGGAINYPTLILGPGVEIPADQLQAALENAAEGVPTASLNAGGAPGSSGGNFAVDPGDIGDPLDLTPLLLPTALAFELRLPDDRRADIEEDSGPTIGASVMVALEEDDLVERGNNEDGSTGLTMAMGSLAVKFGDDGPGSIVFDPGISAPAGLTSNGMKVVYQLFNGGTVLVAYVNNDGMEGFGGELPPALGIMLSGGSSLPSNGAFDMPVFVIEISQDFGASPDGKYTAWLLDNIDHNTPSNDGEDGSTQGLPGTGDLSQENLDNLEDEELEFFNFGFTVTDGNGISVDGQFMVKVQDDIPHIGDTPHIEVPYYEYYGPAESHADLGIWWGSDDGNMEPSFMEEECDYGECNAFHGPGDQDGTEYFSPDEVNVAGNTISFGATDDFQHDFADGEKVIYTNADPREANPADGANAIGGLTPGAYYVITSATNNALAPNQIQLAATLADAQAGNAIDLTSQGNGTQFIHKAGDRSVIFDPALNGAQATHADGTALSLYGQRIIYQLVDDGTKLIAFVDGMGDHYYGDGGYQYGGDGVYNPYDDFGDLLVFEVELSDLGNGEVWFKLYEQIDRPYSYEEDVGSDIQDLIRLNFKFIATDSDGDMVMDSFTVELNYPTQSFHDGLAIRLAVDEDMAPSQDNYLGGTLGTDGDDILVGSAGQNIFTGSEGADTFVLAHLDAVDFITDYNYSEGDDIDLSALLPAALGDGALANYVQIVDNGGEASLEVDTTGGGNSFSQIALLQDISAGDMVKIIYNGDDGGASSGNIAV